jgi:hypothetical protein
MKPEELLAMACEFDMGPEPFLNGHFKWEEKCPKESFNYHVYVKRMPSNSGVRWAIMNSGRSCLNKFGEWEYQSMPSGREEDFFERCRYASREEAIGYYRMWRAAVVKWAEENPRKVYNYDDCPALPQFGK